MTLLEGDILFVLWKGDSEELLLWVKKITLFCVQFVTFFIWPIPDSLSAPRPITSSHFMHK